MSMKKISMIIGSFFSVQLDSGHLEQTSEYARWKEMRDRLAADLRLSVIFRTY